MVKPLRFSLFGPAMLLVALGPLPARGEEGSPPRKIEKDLNTTPEAKVKMDAPAAQRMIQIEDSSRAGPAAGKVLMKETKEKKTAPAPRRLAPQLSGNWNPDFDTFDPVVYEALRLAGIEADLEEIHALSTNGFSPVICSRENEAAWFHQIGKGAALDLIGKRYGAAFEVVPLPEHGKVAAEGDRGEAAFRKRCADLIRARLARGEVVIVEGDLEPDPRLWGIVTRVSEGNEVFCATLNGSSDNRAFLRGSTCWAVRKAGEALDRAAAHQEMLRRAIRRNRGLDTNPVHLYGVDAMSAWIAQLGKVPFCQVCRQARCARSIAANTRNGARRLAEYLKANGDAFPAGIRERIPALAGRYETIAGLLQPVIVDENRDALAKYLGDLTKQAAYARILRKVRRGMLLAARDMEAAVTSTGGDATGLAATGDRVLLAQYGIAAAEVLGGAGGVSDEIAMLRVLLQGTGITDLDFRKIESVTGWTRKGGKEARQAFRAALDGGTAAARDKWAESGVLLDAVVTPSSAAALDEIRSGLLGGRAAYLIGEKGPFLVCGYDRPPPPGEAKILRLDRADSMGKWIAWSQVEKEWWDARERRALVRVARAGAAKRAETRGGAVRRDGDRALLAVGEFLNNGGWLTRGQEKRFNNNSVMAALAAALKMTGREESYETLMGLSGAAFRLQFDWCASAPHANAGFNCMDTVLAALGRPRISWGIDSKNEASAARAKEAAAGSIDSGIPALLDYEECGLAVGYEGKDLLCYFHADPAPAPKKMKQLPFQVEILAPAAWPPVRKDAVARSLEIAVENAWRMTPREYVGFEAYEKWIRELKLTVAREEDRPEWVKKLQENDPDTFFRHCLGNKWSLDSLADARAAAAVYLKSVKGLFAKEVADPLDRAAALCEQVAAVLSPVGRKLRYPWEIKPGEWTEPQRLEQAAALEAALALERKAVAELEAALLAI